MFFSKNLSIAKLFIYVSFSGLVTYVILGLYSLHTAHVSKVRLNTHCRTVKLVYSYQKRDTNETNDTEIKYILMYSFNSSYHHYDYVVDGRYHFRREKCHHRNCYLTIRPMFLNKDMRNFDAVVINAEEAHQMKLPMLRSVKQKYIFHGMAPNKKLACNGKVDGFFNWTWSYRLDSDIVSPFFEVRDLRGEVVAPRLKAPWPNKIERTFLNKIERTFLKSDDLLIYKEKTKAVVALVKHCSSRDVINYAEKLRSALEFYSLTLDICGCDGGIPCPNETLGGYSRFIERNYYFVLVQEEIFDTDYLTASVLTAYLNSAVPLIRSGAHLYSFLPTGSYINVLGNTEGKLAALIHYIINNPAVYHKYFRWKKLYTIRKSTQLSGVCELCAKLNNKSLMETHTSYSNLRQWWRTRSEDQSFCNNVTKVGKDTITYKYNETNAEWT